MSASRPDPPSDPPAARAAQAAGFTPGMSALELEIPDEKTEMESLVAEAAADAPSSAGMTSRKSKAAGDDGATALLSRLYAALPERNQNFSLRNLLLLGGLGGLTFLFVQSAEGTLELFSSSSEPDEGAGYTPGSPHQSSFGGINNIAHPGGAKAAASGQGLAYEDVIIPVPNYGHAVKSLNAENVVNHWGHYVHDEHRSPYASHLYDKPKEELDAEQSKFEEKMKKVREEWGAWSFEDDYNNKMGKDRPVPDFTSVDYRDLPNSNFPDGCWQADQEYVSRFIKEANALVGRVTEGIYAEWGSPLKKKDGTTLTEAEKAERAKKWGPKIVRDGVENNDPNGVAVLSGVAFDGLVRKLLHALITNDDWYAVLGGHSAAAGHGNQFQQNKFITFHRLMEPVFDKLGVRLMSRNMGQGGVGTLQFSLAGSDLYGEADIIEWDSAMTEKGNTVDLWNKQMIMSGEKVPLIISQFHFNIMAETNGTAMMGKYGGEEMVPPTTDAEQAKTLPYAARWLNGKEEKYNAICWEDRKDVAPLEKQDAHPGSQVGWHPGFRSHLFQGRKVALILLKGLEAAFDLWEKGIEEGGFPLAEKYWHVGPTFTTIREHLRTHVNTPQITGEGDDAKDVRSPCEQAFQYCPRVCRVAMHGFGMWEPRAHKDYDFLNIIKPAPNGYRPTWVEEQYYSGFDVEPYIQKIPDGEVDVHAIAIATTFPPPDLDHDWVEGDSEEDGATNVTAATGDKPPTRRWLREATERAFRQRPNVVEVRRSASAADRSSIISSGGEKSLDRGDANAVAIVEKTKKEGMGLGSKNEKGKRKLDDAIIPGRGWIASGWKNEDGFCDGSPQSTCGRGAHSKCLMIGHNDNHKDVSGTSLSGWLVFTVPRVKEGIILARMEWWCGKGDELTKGWREVNNGKTLDETPYNATSMRRFQRDLQVMLPPQFQEGDRMRLQEEHRQLGKPTFDQRVPPDFKMDVAINGKITKTWEKEEWRKYSGEASKNCAVWPLLNDESMAQRDWKEGDEGESVEVAIRFRVDSNPHQGYCISHVYYA